MFRRFATLFLSLGVIGAGLVATASVASAHEGSITISCTSVRFDFRSFSGEESVGVSEFVRIDSQTVFSSSAFHFTPPSGSNVVPIHVGPGTHEVHAHAEWTASGGGHVDLWQDVNCTPPCPPKKLNFRWHYGTFNTSGSWSGTQSTVCPGSLTMGPQSMEGDLKAAPGTTLRVGYDFTSPGNNQSFFVTVNNPRVVFTVRCVSGAAPTAPTFTVTMPTQAYAVSGSGWFPSGDQKSSLVYQGSAAVPNLCRGGALRFDKGGTFFGGVS